jgi:hypothetical protein
VGRGFFALFTFGGSFFFFGFGVGRLWGMG